MESGNEASQPNKGKDMENKDMPPLF